MSHPAPGLHTQDCCVCPGPTDEVDAIGAKRYESQSGGEREIQRTMLELLNQMDGFDARGDVKARASPALCTLPMFTCPASAVTLDRCCGTLRPPTCSPLSVRLVRTLPKHP